ncbi:hypothetical protein JXA32_09560 [Candidatus Sumerlaeota bacterium]|nr:hypothetical protein [Candidatus Sumerlaeota bacterium]
MKNRGYNLRRRMWAKPALPRNRRGLVLLTVIVLVGLAISLALAMVSLSNQQTRIRGRYEVYKDEFAACEEALNKAYAHIQFLITTVGTDTLDSDIAAIQPPTVDGYTFDTFTVTKDATGENPIVSNPGEWNETTQYSQEYYINVTAVKTGGTAGRYDHPGVSLMQTLAVVREPLFNFAIFYDPIMELAPGGDMDIIGKIHGNGDFYIQAGSYLRCHDFVTAAGEIRHGRHPDAIGQGTSNGDVWLTYDGGDHYENMENSDGSWLESTDADWLAESADRWDNYVQANVDPLNLPIPTSSDPHEIIERADASDTLSMQSQKFEYKAGLKIVKEGSNIVGYDGEGNVVNLTYVENGQTKKVYGTSTFYDARGHDYGAGGTTVSSLDIYVDRMVAQGIYPDNGFLYVSNEDSGSQPGVVRIRNADELPTTSVDGFSIATDDSIYIEGDYNTTNKTASMVAGDALYVLSNSWRDSYSTNYGSRYASDTRINAVCIQGIVPTDVHDSYSGGVENYFRLLEQWDNGSDLIFNGSIICLYYSENTGKWIYGNPQYTKPGRIWSWDPDLATSGGPPGVPDVMTIERKSWSMESGS